MTKYDKDCFNIWRFPKSHGKNPHIMQVMDDQRTLSFRAMAGGVSEIPGGTPHGIMDPGCLAI